MQLPSAKEVVNPKEALKSELANIAAVIADMHGKLLQMAVEHERLCVMRDCMAAGYRVMFKEDPKDSHPELPNLDN